MKRVPHGILLVDKAEGESSFDVVRKVRGALGGGRRNRVGHAGTLDPFATGLLVVLVGQGTKLSPFLTAGRKRYRAELVLGTATDTLDPTGKVLRTEPIPPVGRMEVSEVACRFVGEIEQVPPVYSAVKQDGQRAYALARKGKEVKLRPRRVHVHDLRILKVVLPRVHMEVECGAGTYLRSLAADLADALGSCGHLAALRRLSSGGFSVADALPSREIGGKGESERLEERIIPLSQALPEMEEAFVDRAMAERIACGYSPGMKELLQGGPPKGLVGSHLKLLHGQRLLAVARVERDGGGGQAKAKLLRVLCGRN